MLQQHQPIVEGQFALLANGTRLHYASAGSPGKPLILFVHGFPEAWFEWEAQMQMFGSDYYAVAPDLRGFNLSSKPPEVEKYRAKYLVEDLRLLINHLGYEKAIVVAHDWGGAVCWNLAIFLPQIVHKLIIINSPHPYTFMRELANNPAQQQASEYMNWLRQPGSETALAKDDFRLLDGMFTGVKPHQTGQIASLASAWYTPETRARYHAMWSTPGGADYQGNPTHGLTGGVNYYRASPLHPPKSGASMPTTSPKDWTVYVPVRVIWGEQDTALGICLLDGLESVCPDLQITRIPEGGHWVIHEFPDLVNQLIGKYLVE